jgi:PAS domain S-box-containing protein
MTYLFVIALTAVTVWLVLQRRFSQSTAALRQRLENLESALGTASAGEFRLSADWQSLEFSSATAALLGLSRAVTRLRLQQWLEMVDAEQRGQVGEILAAGFKNTKVIEFECRIVQPDGRARWLRCHVDRQRDAADREIIFGIALDITALKEFELELSARHERLRHAALAGEISIWELDVASGSYINDLTRSPGRNSWMKETRPGSATVIVDSKAMSGAWHAEDLPKVASAMRRTIKDKVTYEVEARLTDADGKQQWRRAIGHPIVDESGRTFKVRGFSHNVTARKQAEMQLQATEARLERAIRGMNDGLWELELTSSSLWLAPRCHAMLGFTPEELPATIEALGALLPAQDLQSLKDALACDHDVAAAAVESARAPPLDSGGRGQRSESEGGARHALQARLCSRGGWQWDRCGHAMAQRPLRSDPDGLSNAAARWLSGHARDSSSGSHRPTHPYPGVDSTCNEGRRDRVRRCRHGWTPHQAAGPQGAARHADALPERHCGTLDIADQSSWSCRDESSTR